jgi:GT2 family glycosyltransferase/glycosyltransferase involved in cell wall biosynthesis
LIDVVIPAYLGLSETRRCLESVLSSRVEVAHEITVIDDASPEPALSAWLKEAAASGRFTLIVHEGNRGFVATANEAMALHADRDVVLLNSDTEVADGWLDRIAACAEGDERIGTVTPFSNNATICSYPDMAGGHPLPGGFDVAAVDRAFAEANAGTAIDIPTAVGFCMYITRRCLETVGEFDLAAFGAGYGEEVDFCLRASRAGFRHRLCADAFVFHQGEVSFGDSGAARRTEAQRIIDERYPEFQPAVRDFLARDPAAPHRARAATRLAAIEMARAVALPPVLAAADAAALVVLVGDTACSEASRARRDREANALLAGGVAVQVAEGPGLAARFRAAIAAHPGRDVVVLDPQVLLPYGWDARLRMAAYAAPAVGAAAPLVDGDPAFALLEPGVIARASPEAIDRIAFCLGDRACYEVPGLPSSCAWLRRDALDAALATPSPEAASASALVDALARSLRARGRSCVLCDYLHVTGGSRRKPAALEAVDASALAQHHPLGGLRRAVADALARGLPAVLAPGLDSRPVRLHVMHYWGGGLDKWVRDFARADPSSVHLSLATYRIGESGGQRVVLYADPGARAPIRTWDLARPLRSTAVGSLEYRRILEQIVAEFSIDSVIVSSLIGHSLDVLDLPVPKVVVLHDFYPVCQAINPQFGKTCERCTRDDLEACARGNPLNHIFKDQTTDEWHAMRGHFVSRILAGGIRIVVPSPWMAKTLRQLDPRLEDASIGVVGHGIDLRPPRLPFPERGAPERLRLVVLGRQSRQKGSELLRAASQGLRELADITVVGGGGNGVALAKDCGWDAIESYREEELPGILARIAPRAAVLASVVPETFSYTLSELWNLGVPPLATDLGAFRDRIVHGDGGFLFAPDPDSLVALVRVLHDEPGRLADLAARLAARPPEPSTTDMVAAMRPFLPLEARPAARFRVGIGAQTGLSEPYRHLSEAYSRLKGAYDELQRAYDHTRAAYEQSAGELASVRALWEETGTDIHRLRLKGQWWNAPEALRRIEESREKMRALGAVKPEPPDETGTPRG